MWLLQTGNKILLPKEAFEKLARDRDILSKEQLLGFYLESFEGVHTFAGVAEFSAPEGWTAAARLQYELMSVTWLSGCVVLPTRLLRMLHLREGNKLAVKLKADRQCMYYACQIVVAEHLDYCFLAKLPIATLVRLQPHSSALYLDPHAKVCHPTHPCMTVTPIYDVHSFMTQL